MAYVLYMVRAMQVMRFLISKNANVDARDSAGRPMLFMAAENNQRGSMHVLLEAGCAVNAQSHTGLTGEWLIISSVYANTARSRVPCLEPNERGLLSFLASQL